MIYNSKTSWKIDMQFFKTKKIENVRCPISEQVAYSATLEKSKYPQVIKIIDALSRYQRNGTDSQETTFNVKCITKLFFTAIEYKICTHQFASHAIILRLIDLHYFLIKSLGNIIHTFSISKRKSLLRIVFYKLNIGISLM